MDIQQQKRPHLEPIQEESEQEDETEGSKTGEEEEDFQIFQLGVETEEVMTQDSSEEDEDDAALLRVMRPRRLSRSLRQESFLQMQTTNYHQADLESFSVSHQSPHAVDLSDEASLGNEKRSRSSELRIKISKIKWQKYTPPKPSVQRKTNRTSNKKTSMDEGLFPQWLVDLMVNIEEATTHQLVVE